MAKWCVCYILLDSVQALLVRSVWAGKWWIRDWVRWGLCGAGFSSSPGPSLGVAQGNFEAPQKDAGNQSQIRAAANPEAAEKEILPFINTASCVVCIRICERTQWGFILTCFDFRYLEDDKLCLEIWEPWQGLGFLCGVFNVSRGKHCWMWQGPSAALSLVGWEGLGFSPGRARAVPWDVSEPWKLPGCLAQPHWEHLVLELLQKYWPLVKRLLRKTAFNLICWSGLCCRWPHNFLLISSCFLEVQMPVRPSDGAE